MLVIIYTISEITANLDIINMGFLTFGDIERVVQSELNEIT